MQARQALISSIYLSSSSDDLQRTNIMFIITATPPHLTMVVIVDITNQLPASSSCKAWGAWLSFWGLRPLPPLCLPFLYFWRRAACQKEAEMQAVAKQWR